MWIIAHCAYFWRHFRNQSWPVWPIRQVVFLRWIFCAGFNPWSGWWLSPTPLKKWWTQSQLGWWNSEKSSIHVPVTTNQINILIFPYTSIPYYTIIIFPYHLNTSNSDGPMVKLWMNPAPQHQLFQWSPRLQLSSGSAQKHVTLALWRDPHISSKLWWVGMGPNTKNPRSGYWLQKTTESIVSLRNSILTHHTCLSADAIGGQKCQEFDAQPAPLQVDFVHRPRNMARRFLNFPHV